MQQPHKDALTLTVPPGAFIEQNTAVATSQAFIRETLTNSPEMMRAQNEAEQFASTVKNDAEERRWFEKPVKQEADSQTWFDNAIKRELNIPNGYEKVAVLVIRWCDDLEDKRFKSGHDLEVKRLKSVFGERFHFDVSSEIRLNTVKKPQNILNKAIADHIEAFDGPNNLLIIYYTGHGSLRSIDGEQQLQLSATSSSHGDPRGPWPATAIWCQAEKPLMESAEADVLSLLDCCYAGNAHKGAVGERRTYELLAACHKGQKTRGPGPNSFTTRLLDALEFLLSKPEVPPIIMTRLQNIINTRDTEGLIPVMLSDRLDNHIGRHVQLAPVQEQAKKENEEFQLRPQERAVVKMRFSLEVEELSQTQIEGWARELSKLHKTAKIPIRTIDWIKVEKRQTSKWWKDALEYAQTENRKRKSVPCGSPADDESPVPKRYLQELAPPEEASDVGPPTPASYA